MMKVLKNYFWNVTYQLLVIILPIILIPYVNNKLGPIGIGINSYTNSLAQIFTIMGDLGVVTYGTKTIAEVKTDRAFRSRIFLEITLMRFITIMISYTIFLMIIMLQHQYIKFYLLQGIIILASVFDISWFYMGIEHFKIIAVRNFIVKILTIIFIFSLVKSKNDLGIYIIIMSSSNLFGNLVMFPSLTRWIDLVRISFFSMLKHLKYSLIFFIPQIAMQIYQTLDKFIIGKVVNVEASGFFDNSDKVMNLLLNVIGSLSIVMLPHITSIFHNSTLSNVKKEFYKYFDIVLFISFPMTAGISAISIKFAPWFFGPKFDVVGILMCIESLTIIFIGMSLAFSSYFLSTNQVKGYNLSIIFGAVISLTLGVAFIYFFGLIGSVYSADVTEMFITFLEFVILRKQLSFKELFHNISSYLIGAALIFIIVFPLNLLLPFNFSMFLVEILVGILIYGSTILIMKPTILKYLIILINIGMYKLM